MLLGTDKPDYGPCTCPISYSICTPAASALRGQANSPVDTSCSTIQNLYHTNWQHPGAGCIRVPCARPHSNRWIWSSKPSRCAQPAQSESAIPWLQAPYLPMSSTQQTHDRVLILLHGHAMRNLAESVIYKGQKATELSSAQPPAWACVCAICHPFRGQQAIKLTLGRLLNTVPFTKSGSNSGTPSYVCLTLSSCPTLATTFCIALRHQPQSHTMGRHIT